MSTIYENDFHQWTQQQAEALRAGRIVDLDLEHLAEEIESMGASERRELGSRLKVLLLHLLKWQFQQTNRSSGWAGTIDEQRDQLARLLEQSPSLQRLLSTTLATEYPRARRTTVHETGLSATAFPADCPFTVEQVLDPDYWPA